MKSLRVSVLAMFCFMASSLVADEIGVFAAASLTDALQEIAAAYERRSSDRIVFNFGASSQLALQIREGAPADLFISADEEKMSLLAKQRLLVDSTRVRLLSNTLVVVVPKEERGIRILSLRDLASPRIESIALAEPSSVPAGIYARKLLVSAGLWALVEKKVIPTDNVRSALSAVEAGNVDAAIVYRTDAMNSKRARIALAIARSRGPAISYPAAVLRDAEHPAAARRLLSFLRSKEARTIFERHGFIF